MSWQVLRRYSTEHRTWLWYNVHRTHRLAEHTPGITPHTCHTTHTCHTSYQRATCTCRLSFLSFPLSYGAHLPGPLQAISEEYSKDGIVVQSVCPYFVATAMAKKRCGGTLSASTYEPQDPADPRVPVINTVRHVAARSVLQHSTTGSCCQPTALQHAVLHYASVATCFSFVATWCNAVHSGLSLADRSASVALRTERTCPLRCNPFIHRCRPSFNTPTPEAFAKASLAKVLTTH